MKDLRQMLMIAGGVALGILVVMLLLNVGRVTDKVVGSITGWDDTAKAEYQHQLELNRQFVEIEERNKANLLAIKRQIAERSRLPLCEVDNTCEP